MTLLVVVAACLAWWGEPDRVHSTLSAVLPCEVFWATTEIF